MIYDISYKNLIDAIPLRIRFDKIDGFIIIYDGTRYLTLLDQKNVKLFTTKKSYNLIGQKSGITNIFSHYFEKINIDSYDSLHIDVA